MGFLAKTNPCATRESVILHAKIAGVLIGLGYCVICIWYPTWRDFWWLKLPAAVAFGAFIGAIMEWQLNDNPDIYEIVFEVEGRFGIRVPEFEWKKIVTVGDLFQCVLRAKGLSSDDVPVAQSADQESVWGHLQTLLVELLGVDEDEVTPETAFCADLSVITWADVKQGTTRG